MLIVGLDAASQFKNFGYAIGKLTSDRLAIETAGVIGPDSTVIEQLLASTLRASTSAIVAIDAPLGWPAMLGSSLMTHNAGALVATAKDSLFRRTTDHVVHDVTRKTPLEVGADKIARATHTALVVLDRLRTASGMELPLLWSPTFHGAGVLEVYPAATLKMHAAPSTGYKEPDQRSVRVEIAHHFCESLPDLAQYVDSKSDVFDACLCLLAARDFVAGKCRMPRLEELSNAKKESWIWVKQN